MRSAPRLLAHLTLLASLSTVSACAKRAVIQPLYPPRVDLAVEAQPRPTDAIVTDAQAAAAYDASIEAWGKRGWATVGRICRWSRANGNAIECPPALKGE